MSRTVIRRAALPWFAAVFLTLSGSAVAQTKQVEPAAPSAKLQSAVEERERDFMHPDDPLDIVGIEEGDNGFRDATPTLLTNSMQAVRVDYDENYRRRMAMYERGAVFASPLESRHYQNEGDFNGGSAQGQNAGAAEQGGDDTERPDGSTPWFWVLVGIVTTTLLVMGSRARS